jgi:hypothetical protein
MECETPVLNSHSGSVLGLILIQGAMPKAAEHLIHIENVHHGLREQNKKLRQTVYMVRMYTAICQNKRKDDPRTYPSGQTSSQPHGTSGYSHARERFCRRENRAGG